jgi:hypothetical protein
MFSIKLSLLIALRLFDLSKFDYLGLGWADSLTEVSCQFHCHDYHHMNDHHNAGVINDHHNFNITTYLNMDAVKNAFAKGLLSI